MNATNHQRDSPHLVFVIVFQQKPVLCGTEWARGLLMENKLMTKMERRCDVCLTSVAVFVLAKRSATISYFIFPQCWELIKCFLSKEQYQEST